MTSKIIYEGFVGLHFHNGKLLAVLPQGKYRLWSNAHQIMPIDLRPIYDLIGGQEVSTKDGGGLKVSLLITYRIVDPLLFYRSGEVTPVFDHRSFPANTSKQIHLLVQTALRDWTSGRTFMDAYDQRGDLAADILLVVSEGAKAFGIEVDSLRSLDVSMVGSLRTAYSDLLKTKIEGETALARARNESATMRNLLNTARLVREHPGLLELRVLSSGQKPKVTFVVGSQVGPSQPVEAIESDEP